MIKKEVIQESTEEEVQKVVNYLLNPPMSKHTCDDCVSKAEVFEIMGNLMSIPYEFDRQITEKDVSESMDKIKALTPVTPTRKVGKWEEVWESQRDEFTGEYDEWREHKCSVCGFQEFDADRFKFCPNCGAEMRGVEND